jgi:hypothetical protein
MGQLDSNVQRPTTVSRRGITAPHVWQLSGASPRFCSSRASHAAQCSEEVYVTPSPRRSGTS